MNKSDSPQLRATRLVCIIKPGCSLSGPPRLVNQSILLRSSLTRCTAYENAPTIKSLNRSVHDYVASPPPTPVPFLLLCCTKHLQGLTDKYKTGRGEHPHQHAHGYFSPLRALCQTSFQALKSSKSTRCRNHRHLAELRARGPFLPSPPPPPTLPLNISPPPFQMGENCIWCLRGVLLSIHYHLFFFFFASLEPFSYVSCAH